MVCKENRSVSAVLTWKEIFSLVLFMAFIFSMNAKDVHATDEVVDQLSVEVPVSCVLTSTVDVAHSVAIRSGLYADDIGETTIDAYCNDFDGFSVYAVGYTNDEYGNNKMEPTTVAASNAIVTGTATSGATSNWAMKLTSASENFSLTNGFGSYHEVPNVYTKVATYPSNTVSTGVQVKSTYAAYISLTQTEDTYTSNIKYTIVHPASAAAPSAADGVMQTMDANSCTTTPKRMIDNRDNHIYAVKRLDDGKCWMMENLDLGRTDLTTDLTSANSNLTTTVAAATFNGWRRTVGSNSNTVGDFIPIDGTDQTVNTPYGTLYNYYAVSGGTISGSTNTVDVRNDICPAGWRLPSGGNLGEFKTLYSVSSYNTLAKMRTSMADGGPAFAFAGSFSSTNAPVDTGTKGYYWSSIRSSDSNIYALQLTTSVSATMSFTRTTGRSVRCVLKEPATVTVNYGTGVSEVTIDGVAVQNGGTITLEKGIPYKVGMTPDARYAVGSWSATNGRLAATNLKYTTFASDAAMSSLSVTATYVNTELQNLNTSTCTTTPIYTYDNRDNQTYLVQRLADGKCWMMENLDLGRTTLTTDLTSSNTNLSDTITAATFNGWKKTSGTNKYNAGEFINVASGDPTSGSAYATLYNYHVASAGTISGSSNSSDAEYDICPAGWRLPVGGSSGEYATIYANASYNTAAKMAKPAAASSGGFAVTISGSFNTGAPRSQASASWYWTSTIGTTSATTNMSTMYVTPGYVSVTSSSNRASGFSIRCVREEGS